jgi:hypothetical protein
VQQFRADSAIDLCGKVLIIEPALMVCCMQIALPNRTTFPLPAKRGLVQIAFSLKSAEGLSYRGEVEGSVSL